MNQIPTSHQDPDAKTENATENVHFSSDLYEFLDLILKRKRFILTVVGFFSIAAVVISLILPESFTSTAVLLPETDQSKLANLGGLSDIASLAGLNLGGEASLVKLYPTILKSEAVLKNVIYRKYQTKKFSQPVDLIQYWQIQRKTPAKDYAEALKTLRGMLQVSLDIRTNVITISLEEGDPQLAADIVNAVTEELDKFFRTKKSTSAGEERTFIEGRLKAVGDDLESSENALKNFREKNRSIGGSPELMLQQERLVRNVQINSTIYTELRRQYEIARIEEVKNTPIISIMDEAQPAAYKSSPMRGRMCIITFFVALVGSIGYVYVSSKYKATILEFLKYVKSGLLK